MEVGSPVLGIQVLKYCSALMGLSLISYEIEMLETIMYFYFDTSYLDGEKKSSIIYPKLVNIFLNPRETDV